MLGVGIHAVVYVAVNAVLVTAWALTTGSFEELGDVWRSPSDAWSTYAFWPAWVVVPWGALLAIHAGIATATLPGRRRRKLARRLARAVPTPPLPAAGPGRQRVTILFSDIVGSTDLAEQLGDDEWQSVLLAHRVVVRAAIADHGGTEVGTLGDGFLVRFTDEAAAVAAAVRVQRDLEARRAAGDFTPPVRIGIHAGEANDADGDLVGRTLNLASRVCAAAAPGEVLVTEPVADRLPTAAGLSDRGLVPLKGVSQPRHLLAVDTEVL